MTWFFQFVCALFGHADTVRLRSTKRRPLHDQNGSPTGFLVVTEREYLQCKRCGTEIAEVGGEAKMHVRKIGEKT